MTAMHGEPATVVFTVYRQAAYVREALHSVFAQTHAPLEIIVSDDASNDGSFEILRDEVAAYRGPHDVVLNRNAQRLGNMHARACIARAKHDIVVAAHGDDIQRPDRVSRLVEAMRASDAAVLTSDAMMIDADGKPLGLLEGSGRSRFISVFDIIRTGWQPTMLGATFAHRRSKVFAFDRPHAASPPTFDLVRCFRTALSGGLYFLAEPLLGYRRHAGNAGNFIADYSAAPDVFKETITASEVSTYGWMAGDLEAWIAHCGRSESVDAIERALHDACIRLIDATVVRRLSLLRRGLKPVWIDHKEMAHRPIRDEYRLRPSRSAGDETGAPPRGSSALEPGATGGHRRVVAEEVAPGFGLVSEAPRPELGPLFAAVRNHSGAAFVGLCGHSRPARPRLRPLDLDGILAEPWLWSEPPIACGVADSVLAGMRPVRIDTHPPLTAAIFALRGLAMGGSVMIDSADPAPSSMTGVPCAIEDEARLAWHLMVLSAVRRDLMAMPSDDPQHRQCAAMADAIRRRLVGVLQQWSYRRALLWFSDKRPTWVPRTPAA